MTNLKIICLFLQLTVNVEAFSVHRIISRPKQQQRRRGPSLLQHRVLSDSYLENDLVAVKVPSRLSATKEGSDSQKHQQPTRLCVVRQDCTVLPLCQHEDDVETDLFIDPRTAEDTFYEDISDEDVLKVYGEGFYGQVDKDSTIIFFC
jgi:hypothetical protein